MTHKLEADSICLAFDNRKILSDIYIKCETGRITGLLGRNGAGKSSLFNIIYGSMKCPDKSVRFDHKFTPQAFKQPELLTYLPQFSFVPASLSIRRIFEDFRLDFIDFQNCFPHFKENSKIKFKELSGGNRRLIELFLIIKSPSQFSLLDEPFSHIMPVHINHIKAILSVEKLKKGFIITDHLYPHIIDISDDLVFLANGKTQLVKNIQDLEILGYLKP